MARGVKKGKPGRPKGSKSTAGKVLIDETAAAVKMQLLMIAADKKTSAKEKMEILEWVRRN